MLRDRALGTLSGARWKVSPFGDEPAQYGATVAAVRSINELARRHDRAWLEEWRLHARRSTHYQCRMCGRWLRVIDERRADRIIATHSHTNACQEQAARRNLVWQGLIPGHPDRSRTQDERATALEARRFPDGVWVSLVRQLREWKLSHDAPKALDRHASWAALEDETDAPELEALAITWTHHTCLEDTYDLQSRQLLRDAFARRWVSYLRESRPHVLRVWLLPRGASISHAELDELVRTHRDKGLVTVRLSGTPDERGNQFTSMPAETWAYRAVTGPREQELYQQITDALGPELSPAVQLPPPLESAQRFNFF
jgi:hypothetical protein